MARASTIRLLSWPSWALIKHWHCDQGIDGIVGLSGSVGIQLCNLWRSEREVAERRSEAVVSRVSRQCRVAWR